MPTKINVVFDNFNIQTWKKIWLVLKCIHDLQKKKTYKTKKKQTNKKQKNTKKKIQKNTKKKIQKKPKIFMKVE